MVSDFYRQNQNSACLLMFSGLSRAVRQNAVAKIQGQMGRSKTESHYVPAYRN